eukprot:TRINITY_DN52143_c0_g1_i1.p1 TRINITY_DN52143_c0_g1~~TRINITY_DN52143_c0_g1_i1.p1  ORF type:complete len:509 (-),score=79.24 TRINITY_DN52143_c0_g1_i1:141-1667(-)
MTWGPKHLIGVLAAARGDAAARDNYFGMKKSPLGDWGSFGNAVYVYLWGAHVGHALDFGVALLCYFLFYADGAWVEEAATWSPGWVSQIVLFNLACGLLFPGFWHWYVYASPWAKNLEAIKLNKVNQYEPSGGRVGLFTSSTGHLEREITFTTLGWLQSAFWQCLITHVWAAGYLPFYASFLSCPAWSVFVLFAITYWREIHFYHCHRAMHPWFDAERGLLDGDIGAFLYRHVHSLHHKSHNPGPWAGLCMHPVEHLMYYSCATLMPLVLVLNPLHFLYCKFHCDIAPIGGHDGYDDPGPNGDFHWLHHHRFECNYGVPWPVNFDKIWGTWADPAEFKKTGVVRANGEWANKAMHVPEGQTQLDDKQEPLLASGGSADEALPSMTRAEVAKRDYSQDCWIVLYGQVVDVTDFVGRHPGGETILRSKAGQDATKVFQGIHAGGFSLIAKHFPDTRIVATCSDYTGPQPPEVVVTAASSSSRRGARMPGIFLWLMSVVAASTALYLQAAA